MSGIPLGERTLSVLLDVRQPTAYLALHPARAFAEECGVSVDWLPIAVPPLKAPTEPAADDDRGVRHRRHRAHAIAREIEIYGGAQGLCLRELYRDPDPSAFHLAWLWLRERHEAHLLPFLTEAFRAYWALDLDPSKPGEVVPLLGAAGAGFDAWCEREGPQAAEALAVALAERGVARAPAYLVEDEIFVGRQHLPMIRWILDGRVGPGPI